MAFIQRPIFPLLLAGCICLSYSAYPQPTDFSNCPSCEQKDITLHTETVNVLQGIRGYNPYRPYTYGLIGTHKFSGTGYVISNPFWGYNWFPIRKEKQMMTGTFIDFGVSNFGDESDWNIHLLPDPQFQDLITEALPYQKDNWYPSGDWRTGPDGRFLIEAEITPDEKRYGNPWFTNQDEHSPLINKKISVYGPFVREEAHGNHPEIHPAEQIWWQEANGQHIILLAIDDSNRFKDLDDYSADRVNMTPFHPWVAESGQRATMSYAFEVNPNSGGLYVAIQAIDDLEFFEGADFRDASEGTKHEIRYKGNIVLTVQEADATDKYLGIKFSKVCFNAAKGTLQGFIDIETAIGNGDGREGFVALQINKQEVGLNARPALVAGDLLNTWKNVGPYDDKVSFSDIYRGNALGNGYVHGIIDFNGNGKSDLFAKKGDQWLVLYDGKGSWQELNSSSIPVSEYRFGDINGDRKTDILRNGPNNKIMISYGGTSQWQELTEGGEQNKNFLLGDFDGNGRADILYVKFKPLGNTGKAAADMYVKYNGAGSFKELNTNFHFSDNGMDFVNNFRFGNFNADNITDIFRFNNNKFRVYWSGRGDIKDLADPGPNIRMADLLFVQNLTLHGRTDIIHVDPQTKTWTVFNSGQPGTLPLTIKHADRNVVVFADLDADPAVEPIALEMVSGQSTIPNFPMARKVELLPTVRAGFVPGSLKRVSAGNTSQLVFNQDLRYFEGRSTNRSAPARVSVSSVKDMSTARDIAFRNIENTTTPRSEIKHIARIENVTLTPGKEKTYEVNFSGTAAKKIEVPAYAISGTINHFTATAGEAGSWEAWKAYLRTVAKPGKDAMLQQPLTTPVKIRSISFELAPFYTRLEEEKLSDIEIDDVAKELNATAYGNDATKRTSLFGNANVFTISWTYELKNLSTGQVMSVGNPGSIASNGKWTNNKIAYTFPASNDLLQLTAKATVKDVFGHAQPGPLEFVFWNQQLNTDGSAAQLNNWLNQFLGGRAGYIWVNDHWERARAGQPNQPQPLQLKLAYLAEDKILTVKELEQIVK